MPNYVPIGLGELRAGMTIEAWHGSGGRGGEILELDRDGEIVIAGGTARIEFSVSRAEITAGEWRLFAEVPWEASDCVDRPSGRCGGPVEMHSPGGSAQGRLRCDVHAAERRRYYDTSMERYADSRQAPDWFDPEAAGERWDVEY